VRGGEDRVHAASGGNDGDIRSGSTEVCNDYVLVGDLGIWASIVGQYSADWLMDKLESLNASILSSLDKGLFLLLAEVGWDGDDGGVDLLACEVGSGLRKTLDKASGDLGDGDGRWLALLLILDCECDSVLELLWVGGGVAVGWVYRLEAKSRISIVQI
jgi:hypothetical protein